MTWLHVTNNTGNVLTVYFVGPPFVVRSGKWCYGWAKEPHCPPKEKP